MNKDENIWNLGMIVPASVSLVEERHDGQLFSFEIVYRKPNIYRFSKRYNMVRRLHRMANKTHKENNYLRNFGIMIPKDVVRTEDGTPAIFARHKQEFIDYLKSMGRLGELQNMSWSERDKEYLKWENELKDKK